MQLIVSLGDKIKSGMAAVKIKTRDKEGSIKVTVHHPYGTNDIMLSYDLKWKVIPLFLGQHGTHVTRHVKQS